MKRLLTCTFIFILALFSVGCEAVTGGRYTLPRGAALSGDLLIAGGNAALEQGSRVTGAVFVVGGSVRADGEIDGDVLVAGGNIDFGPGAVVRGVVRKAGGSVNIAGGASVPFGEPFAVRTPGGVIGNLLKLSLLFPLLFIVVIIILFTVVFSARPSRTAAPQTAVAPAAPATAAPAVVDQSAPAAAAPAVVDQTSAPTRRAIRSGSGVVLGIILIIAGVLFLLQEFLNVDVWQYSWPILIVAAGLFCFVAMVLSGKDAAGLAIPGSILTVLGLVLLFQNAFDLFESWAYAWALIFPTSIGIGRYVEGWRSDRPALRELGIQQTRTGLIIFVLLAAFFELVLNLSGFFREDIGQLAFPALLILAGVLLLSSRFIRLAAPRPALSMPVGTGSVTFPAPKEPDKQPPAGK